MNSNKIRCTKEFLEDILKLSDHGIKIVDITSDPITGNVVLHTEGSQFDSEYISLRYTRPYDVDGAITQVRQDVVLEVIGSNNNSLRDNIEIVWKSGLDGEWLLKHDPDGVFPRVEMQEAMESELYCLVADKLIGRVDGQKEVDLGCSVFKDLSFIDMDKGKKEVEGVFDYVRDRECYVVVSPMVLTWFQVHSRPPRFEMTGIKFDEKSNKFGYIGCCGRIGNCVVMCNALYSGAEVILIPFGSRFVATLDCDSVSVDLVGDFDMIERLV